MLFLALAFVPQDIVSATNSMLDRFDINLAQTSEKGSAQHLIVVIDDSASMRYQMGDGNRSDAYSKSL
ncbi:MAG: hypothetical protein KDB07_06695, partial [Planctomycetes bacterium]|nr:hypothetical protein [Planctomycetota bacterium]